MELTYPAVHVHPDRQQLGLAAAQDIIRAIEHAQSEHGHARVVFAAAPSQTTTLDALATTDSIDWTRVTAFQMDEYLDLPGDHPARFGNWLRRSLFDRVPIGRIELIEPTFGPAAYQEAERYTRLIREAPIDLVICGIGTNGHLAFNDPPADFDSADTVSLVTLTHASRQQQVDDGLFGTIEQVPSFALTLTIPALMSAQSIVCVVPGTQKADAVYATLREAFDPQAPASALHGHHEVMMHLDMSSAARLGPQETPADSIEPDPR